MSDSNSRKESLIFFGIVIAVLLGFAACSQQNSYDPRTCLNPVDQSTCD